ncbi:MAG: helix-turn-helix transcriptional regulator [Lachnospiraceae bacterium]|nr:helix-turn-helix transcriptional regulator [Lachnospiraceae bacterium]
MIDYEPFWNTLEKSNENWYTLTNKHNINPATFHRLKHGKPVSTVTIDSLCRILDCNVEDIMKYVPN